MVVDRGGGAARTRHNPSSSSAPTSPWKGSSFAPFFIIHTRSLSTITPLPSPCTAPDLRFFSSLFSSPGSGSPRSVSSLSSLAGGYFMTTASVSSTAQFRTRHASASASLVRICADLAALSACVAVRSVKSWQPAAVAASAAAVAAAAASPGWIARCTCSAYCTSSWNRSRACILAAMRTAVPRLVRVRVRVRLGW